MCINCNDPLQINLTTGPQGPAGPAPGITATASTGAVGVAVTSPSIGNYNLAFSIPSGAAGSNGTNGADGAYGGVSFPYVFTGYNGGSSDPGAGNLRFNGVNIVGTSSIHISNANTASLAYFTFGQNLYQNIIYGVTNSIKGLIKVFKKSDPTNFAVYQITGVTNQGTNWTTFSVTNIGFAGTLSNTDNVLVSFTVSGNSAINNTGILSVNQIGPANINSVGSVTYSNTFLTYNSGALLCAVPASTTSSVSNPSAIDLSSYFTANGTWNAWTAGYYQFNWYVSLTIPSGTSVNGWWNGGTTTPQAIMAGIVSATGAPNQNNTYTGNQWICPNAPTRQMILSGTSNVIPVNAGDIFTFRLINMTGVNYVSQAGDVAKWSVTRFA